jgi:hypothetical protein
MFLATKIYHILRWISSKNCPLALKGKKLIFLFKKIIAKQNSLGDFYFMVGMKFFCLKSQCISNKLLCECK